MSARPLLIALVFCTACPTRQDTPPGSATVLRKDIGVDLLRVTTIAVVGTSPAQPLTGPGTRRDGLEGGSRLLALTASGETLEFSLVEQGTPDAGPVAQPNVRAVFPTASWVLFSTPNFSVSGQAEPIECSIIAARRADGALFCAPLFANNGWSGADTESTIVSNAAGDVVYFIARVVGPQHTVSTSSAIYRLTLGEAPAATGVVDASGLPMLPFRANAIGDLFVNHVTSRLAGTFQADIVPVDGGAIFTVSGQHNGDAASGNPGDDDENTFYVVSGGNGGFEFDGTIKVVTRSGGASFGETPHVVNFAFAGGYRGLLRLSDGLYMYSFNDKSLARVIADGGFIDNPTPVRLVGVSSIAAGGELLPVSGRWVFIANTGTGFKFVRHDGASQQDIPLDNNLDVWGFTVSPAGAIDFLGVRTATQEKVRGTIAAGATVVTFTSAGAFDPAQLVAFTRIN